MLKETCFEPFSQVSGQLLFTQFGVINTYHDCIDNDTAQQKLSEHFKQGP